jgi:hypothetical protein
MKHDAGLSAPRQYDDREETTAMAAAPELLAEATPASKDLSALQGNVRAPPLSQPAEEEERGSNIQPTNATKQGE